MQTIRVGLPCGLLHYQYGSMWEKFFYELGAQVVTSGPTTQTMIDTGSILDEVCLPVKVYAGHAANLADQVDYLFVPRIVSVARGQYTCPKIMGLPDVLRSNLADLPPMLDVNVSVRQRSTSLFDAVINIGARLGQGKLASIAAWYRAWQSGRSNSSVNLLPASLGSAPQVGLIGHSYIIYDRFISMDTIGKLLDLGMNVVTPAMIEGRQISAAAASLSKPIYWSYCKQLAGAALAMINQPSVDGLIFMTSFSCGPDSMVGETVKRKARAAGVPFMFLNLDEHTAEAGLVTRLEAFTDMLKRR